MLSPRVAPALVGMGLLEAVPEAAILARADAEDADGDGISGRAARTGDGALGRFGWKAAAPSLLVQNARAALHDIGLTTPLLPENNCPAAQTLCAAAPGGGEPEVSGEFLEKLTKYARLLAVPARRGAKTAAALRGAEVFARIGCGGCHSPTMRTGKGGDILPELRGQVFHPYTDLLLHDMGAGLADNRPEGAANGKEWRTAPLWSLGLTPMVNGHNLYLHDGRARGLEEAILWHAGEAKKAQESYRHLQKPDRKNLLAFLRSL